MVPPPVPPALQAPAPVLPLRAQYRWGYAGAEGEGVGTLSLLLEPASGRLIAELHGMGERLVLVEGNRSSGYRVQVPRQRLDRRAVSLAELPLPFLPQVASVEALLALLRTGEAPGVSVLKRDARGPLKLHWQGRDPKGKEEQVWLERQRWEEGK